MRITFLGTGTSQGVPVITCSCPVCCSDDKRDKRLRSSVLIELGGRNVLIDTSPDFRYQMLKHQVSRLDAILFTHEHNDHTSGLDDIRPFNFRQQYDMPVFGLARVLDDVKLRYRYIFEENPYPGTPRVICHTINPNEAFHLLDDIKVTPIEVKHGNLKILGYRVGEFAYITDASELSETAMNLLYGVRILVINALQVKPHYAHFTLDEALQVAQSVAAERTFLTHISHNLGLYRDLSMRLPDHILPAYDGLQIEI